MSRATPSSSWNAKRQSLLFAACNAIATLLQDDIPVAHAIRHVARKFRGRSLGKGRRLALSPKTMRRHWDRWNSTPARKRNESIFRYRYKAGSAELNPLLLPLIAEFAIRQGRTLAEFLRVVRPTTADGKRLSHRTIHRRIPVREIQRLAFAHRRLIKQAFALEEKKAALANKVLGASRR
jgi:hypothetical protein